MSARRRHVVRSPLPTTSTGENPAGAVRRARASPARFRRQHEYFGVVTRSRVQNQDSISPT